MASVQRTVVLQTAAIVRHRKAPHPILARSRGASGPLPNAWHEWIQVFGVSQVQVNDVRPEVGNTDSIYFGGDVPHSYLNGGDGLAVAYLVMTYPQPVSY
jgi:hypothetical protein